MTTTQIGREAEELAAAWLIQNGYTIMARNWRTRWCEIDIVAERQGVIHVVEVKHRRRPDSGTGLEYIHYDKARRLRNAASMWLQSTGRYTAPYQIDIIATSGFPKPQKLIYLPNALAAE